MIDPRREAAAAAGHARILGRPLKPHQSAMVAALAEPGEGGTGYAADWVVLMPRQVGKRRPS